MDPAFNDRPADSMKRSTAVGLPTTASPSPSLMSSTSSAIPAVCSKAKRCEHRAARAPSSLLHRFLGTVTDLPIGEAAKARHVGLQRTSTRLQGATAGPDGRRVTSARQVPSPGAFQGDRAKPNRDDGVIAETWLVRVAGHAADPVGSIRFGAAADQAALPLTSRCRAAPLAGVDGAQHVEAEPSPVYPIRKGQAMGVDPDAFRRAHLQPRPTRGALASSSGSVENLERLGVASGLQSVILACLSLP